MSSVKDIFRSSSDSDESFEGFSITEMTKTKKTSSGKQSQKQSGAGNSRKQDPTEPRAGPGRPTSQDGGDADGGPDRSTSMVLEGSDRTLPPIDMDPTPQMRETPSPDTNDISTRFVHLENLVEMIAMHVDHVEPEDPATTPEDLSSASEPATTVGDVEENVNDEHEATPSMLPRKKRKLAESSGNEPNHGEDNDIFFYHLDEVQRLILSMIQYPSM